ncbi:MAG: hypothetical protein H6810_05985 [Phycisphaeraceae bacterium]|nr:MAG: hypothetical protein H6810_05985 [Phycisphaeraceae bacterium]
MEPQDQTTGAEPIKANVQCVGCGYNLLGLSADGVCPECGTPLEESLRGYLLVHRSGGHVARLKRGVSFIVAGLLFWVAVQIIGIVVALITVIVVVRSPNTQPPALLESLVTTGSVIDLAVSAVILFGWWLFTARDPADPVRDRDANVRRGVRSAVIAQIALQLISLVLVPITMSGGTIPMPGSNPQASPLFVITSTINFLAGLGVMAAVVVQFVAGMLYVRRLALRLPDARVHRLARNRMISCPIWMTIGSFIFIGPVIALLLYWNLLNMVRKNLNRILKEQAAGQMGGTAGEIAAL